MPSFKNLAIAAKRVRYGLTTPSEFLLSFVDSFTYNVFGKNFGTVGKKTMNRKHKEFFENNAYNIKGAKIPLLDESNRLAFFTGVINETFGSYLYFNDNYDEKLVDFFSVLGSDLYGLKNDKIDVTVNAGDIVIDAGSWIGDFAAYASAKGAVVYAFEPMDETFKYLEQTAKLNPNITALKKGLSNEDVDNKTFFINLSNDEGNTFSEIRVEEIKNEAKFQTSNVDIIRLDTFVKENNLERVDFIKADIEGAERDMLAGAQETLKKFAPKLALCTYHLPDDPYVMADLIKKANPKYIAVS